MAVSTQFLSGFNLLPKLGPKGPQKVSNPSGDPRATLVTTRLPGPVSAEALPVPPNDRLRLDDHQGPPPIRPATPKDGPESSIEIVQSRSPMRTGQENGELLAQNQVLEGQLASGPESGYGGSEQHPRRRSMVGEDTPDRRETPSDAGRMSFREAQGSPRRTATL